MRSVPSGHTNLFPEILQPQGKTSECYRASPGPFQRLLDVQQQKALDFVAKTAMEFAYIHYMFQKADEFYRYYREALLNHESNWNEPKPVEWIPISKQ